MLHLPGCNHKAIANTTICSCNENDMEKYNTYSEEEKEQKQKYTKIISKNEIENIRYSTSRIGESGIF